MKKLLIFACIFLFGITMNAQVSVGARLSGPYKDFPKGTYKEIANKKTIFVVDDLDITAYENMLKDVWTVNDYEVIERSAFKANKKSYISDKYVISEVVGVVNTRTNTQTGSTTTSVYVYQFLYHYHSKKKDGSKLKRRTIAGVFLTADGETINKTIASQTFANLDKDYHNYGLGYLKNYFQLINRELKNEGYYFAYDSDENKKELRKLKKATLYVPDYLKSKLNAFTGTDSEKENPDDLFKKYDYSFEWISKDALNEKILNAKDEDLFYISWVRANSQKFVNVINARTGEIIYEDYEVLAYNIKKNDISRLASKIK